MTQRKPDLRPPQTFDRSYRKVGIVAQRARAIEIRAPDPDLPTGRGWPRIWVDVEAAEKLHVWLGQAIHFVRDQSDEEAAK